MTGLRGPPKIIGGFVERAGDWLKKVVGERQLIFLRSGCLGDDCFHPASHHTDGPDLVPSGENRRLEQNYFSISIESSFSDELIQMV